MGLFSSKSSSKSTTTNQTTNTYTDQSMTTSGTIGDLSTGNTIAGGNVTGYSAEETNKIINSTLDTVMSVVDGIKDVTGKAITQVQSAYSGANDSIMESQNETKATLNSLKPYAFYLLLGAVAYFVWGKRR